jgi:hypothetical protein
LSLHQGNESIAERVARSAHASIGLLLRRDKMQTIVLGHCLPLCSVTPDFAPL